MNFRNEMKTSESSAFRGAPARGVSGCRGAWRYYGPASSNRASVGSIDVYSSGPACWIGFWCRSYVELLPLLGYPTAAKGCRNHNRESSTGRRDERGRGEKIDKMQRSDRTLWIFVLVACLAGSLVSVAYPLYVIRPFRAQGARELIAALVVARYGPLVSAVSALAAVAAAVAYWRSSAPLLWRRLAAASAMLVCVLAVLARVNVFESLMFHPLEHPAFATPSEVKLDDDDKLIVVKIGGSARAYPVREMGYHHVVNDMVGGTALVATY